MYPQIELFSGVTIYTFGLSLSIAFVLFFAMLHKLSHKFGINTNFFIGNWLAFFLSMFVFSRLFSILAEWQDSSAFLMSKWALKFFFFSDYNFSLTGGIFGFFLILIYKLIRYKLPSHKYLDAVTLSFFFAGIVGYIGAFLGGQIYGKPTHMIFGIIYNNPESANPYTSAVIPLALIYAFFCFVLFVALYIARMSFIKLEGLVAYIGFVVFGAVLLVGEFFNGSDDALRSIISLDLTQITALIFIFLAVRWFAKLSREAEA